MARRARSPKTPRAIAPPVAGAPRRVVVVAGSAGSLTAIQRFFAALPPDTTATFIVAVHRTPKAQELLAELVAGYTSLPVKVVVHGELLSPGAVYVVPNDRKVSLQDHRFVVGAMARSRHTIDAILTAVTRDVGGDAVGVLLSGMNDDGTAGLKALRAAGGRVLVQDPATAEYDVMPRSAIDAGVADVVGSPEDLAASTVAPTLDVLRHDAPDAPDDAAAIPAIEAILARLELHTGRDLGHYKRSTLLRRIDRRMAIVQAVDRSAYAERVERDPAEARALLDDLLIGVTSFFREPDAFDVLRTRGLPSLLPSLAPDRPLRIWIAGCATGEEAFSIAIVVREWLDALPTPRPSGAQIYATDLDAAAIDRARQGLFDPTAIANVSPELVQRYFTPEGRQLRIRRDLRDMVVFAVQDLTSDPPFTRLDLLSCRNVLIYFDADMQKRLMGVFHFALRPGGLLVLGGAESLGGWASGFEVVDARARVFRRRALGRGELRPLDVPPPGRAFVPTYLRSLADRSPQDVTTPARPEGDSVRDVVRAALEELGITPPSAPGPSARRSAGRDLRKARERIVALAEQLESFRRDAQVTYEELQSTNEELKSTNEELVTAREETQSMNEELLTLNAELQAKNEALEVTNDDMRNLLDGSQVPTLFLDGHLRLKRYTHHASRIANLIPADVGRPLSDIALHVQDARLESELRQVLTTLVAIERRVQSKDGSVFTMRIHPYRTAQNVVDGVVVSFIDVTTLLEDARVERGVRQRATLGAVVARWPGVAYVLDAAGRVVAVSDATSAILGYPRELVAHGSEAFWRALDHPDDSAPAQGSDPGTRRRRIRCADGRYRAFAEQVLLLDGEAPGGTLRLVVLDSPRSDRRGDREP